ncbi:uncharacterized protein LOC126884580 isoform X2 [Diabrotica virgifera virgifera]|uniref:Icarapin-like n=1 Tax=Diabrotica virgifera virgifera TaxID=50390 RepID=A0ABM5K8K3_DIAVI|nr:uncharacterized protein LOC126884580 isoform X2 [Diabrotica virgifera virgifera]
MRGTLAVIALLGYLCCTTALPATSKQIDDDIELFSPKETHVEQPVIDTDAGFGFDGFSNHFSGLFDNFESILTKIKQQMDQLMNSFPVFRTGNSTGDFPDFPNFGGDLPQIPQFGDIDLSKGNTTSETKIIDGHKVVINNTQYHKDGENGSAFFQVRVIDVQPTETEDATASANAMPKDREDVENSIDNEIIKNKEAVYYQPLDLDELDSGSKFRPTGLSYLVDNSEWDDLNKIESIDDNALNFNGNQPEFDLSRDTYVNELLAKSGAPVNPDAEIIKPIRVSTQRVQPDAEIIKPIRVSTQGVQPLISSSEKPYDLSRDTYVNEILAKSGATTNSDAEVFETSPKASTEAPMLIGFQPKR